MPNQPGRMGFVSHEKPKIKNSKQTLLRLLRYTAPMKGSLLLTFGMAIVSTVIGIVGTRLNGIAVDEFIAHADILGLMKICLLLAGLFVIAGVSIYFQSGIMVRVSQYVTFHIRKDLFTSLQKLPLKYFDNHSSGDLMSRLTNDVDNINNTLSQSVAQFFGGIFNIIGMLIAMTLLSLPLTLIAVILLPLVILLTKQVASVSKKYFRSQQKEIGALGGFVEEMVSGQKAVILFGRAQTAKEEFANINGMLRKSSMLSQSFSGLMGPLMNLLNNITFLVIAAVGGYLILSGSGMTVGIVFTFLLYMKNFSRPIVEIANLFSTIQSAIAGAERVFEVMDEKKEQDSGDEIQLEKSNGNITARDVTFSYLPDKPVLKHASFDAKPGQTIAIVGPTGAGKTTIISLLTRFYELDGGEITLDGVPISKITRDNLRRNIGMVLQDTYLFSESVLENIRYGRQDATDEEVKEAARQAGAESFILHLDDGYDTVLSDNAQDLSQGQRQLLAIARAMLARPSILILDEATSSIDTRTELKIQKALQILMKGRTNFVIAHRLSTIRGADMILVIDNGEIIERGTHDELLEQNGFYANLYNSQFRTGLSI